MKIEIGKTYIAKNGVLVQIISKRIGEEAVGYDYISSTFHGREQIRYSPDGMGTHLHKYDKLGYQLIKEISREEYPECFL